MPMCQNCDGQNAFAASLVSLSPHAWYHACWVAWLWRIPWTTAANTISLHIDPARCTPDSARCRLLPPQAMVYAHYRPPVGTPYSQVTRENMLRTPGSTANKARTNHRMTMWRLDGQSPEGSRYIQAPAKDDAASEGIPVTRYPQRPLTRQASAWTLVTFVHRARPNPEGPNRPCSLLLAQAHPWTSATRCRTPVRLPLTCPPRG